MNPTQPLIAEQVLVELRRWQQDHPDEDLAAFVGSLPAEQLKEYEAALRPLLRLYSLVFTMSTAPTVTPPSEEALAVYVTR